MPITVPSNMVRTSKTEVSAITTVRFFFGNFKNHSFILTKTFWLSIPWWLYILLVGSILVGFAIYNEIREKKDNNVKNRIENIKDNLNL